LRAVHYLAQSVGELDSFFQEIIDGRNEALLRSRGRSVIYVYLYIYIDAP
jgi:hypothetical protein